MASVGRVLLFIQLFTCCIPFITVTFVHSAPIQISRWTFNNCQPGSSLNISAFCCPPKPIKEPIVDFKPKYHPFKPLRVRKALQCLSGTELETYIQKLQRGYALMRALPDSDPRSLKRQTEIHCAYGTGSFLQTPSSNLTIDVHFNWLFFPWHRLFVYFQEKILQKLLNDPNFTLHFWNFDNGITNTSAGTGCCGTVGHFFPSMYNDPDGGTFTSNRSSRPFELARPVDLSWDVRFFNFSTGLPPVFPNYTVEEQVRRNREILHRTFVTVGNTTSGFFGKTLRVGEVADNLNTGSFELWPHISLHYWIGGYHGFVQTSAGDPVFYTFHANVERLWSVWRTLDEDHLDPTDPDWLDATFLLWDENAVLRRVQVRDLVHTEALGYVYQKVNDASWIYFDNSTNTST